MRVREISLANIMSHKDTLVVLPEKGIVLVTGPNGSGKSSIIEAVSVGAWETPLRKKPVWAADRASIHLKASVGSDEIAIARQRVKSKTTLLFTIGGGPSDKKYETKTKGQEALERVIGSHSLWRRTHVFSSSDADHFTSATDGERKRLLEELLGLDRFDAAAAKASTERRAAERALATEEQKLLRLEYDLQSKQDRHTAALDALARLKPGAVVDVLELARIEEEIEEKEEAALLAGKELGLLRAKVAQLDSQKLSVDAAAREVAGLAGGECPVCQQPVGEEHSLRIHAHATTVKQEQVAPRKEIAKRYAEVEAQHRALTHDIMQLRDKRSVLHERKRAEAARLSQVAELQETSAATADASQGAAEALEAARVALAAQRASCANLGAAERVLSLGGVRAHLLGQALGGIEEVANGWLSRMCPGRTLELRLSPYSEKASGGIKDSIGLEVEGAGNGHGYLATSGGERRRIDIALMLALAEVAEAAAGTTSGTLFFDEVFDALDDEGVDAACALLEELAQNRCVVVISHNDSLKHRLKSDCQIQVTAKGLQASS